MSGKKGQKWGIKGTPMVCEVPKCEKPQKGKGYCDGHLQRLRKYGDVLAKMPLSKSIMHLKNKNTRWKGGSFIVSGRMVIYSPNHPYPNHGGKYVYRYRLAMEKKIGRFLLPNEIVHHKNGNPMDDNTDNLELITHSEHSQKHALLLHRNSKGQFENGMIK